MEDVPSTALNHTAVALEQVEEAVGHCALG